MWRRRLASSEHLFGYECCRVASMRMSQRAHGRRGQETARLGRLYDRAVVAVEAVDALLRSDMPNQLVRPAAVMGA